MKPHLNAITLAVDDLECALDFYRDGLGLPTNGIFGNEFPGSARPLERSPCSPSRTA
jgi:catechol 2,3-dioxygenase-like lactoylglutathione lyase family enzyme